MKLIGLHLVAVVFSAFLPDPAAAETTTLNIDAPLAPSLEPCPSDSVLAAGVCKCDPAACRKPPCLSELREVSAGSDEPGNCCARYSCDGCSQDERIDGACPCAPNATLNSQGECRCVNPAETLSLENNTCVCDPSKCNLPELCDKRSVATRVLDGCCEKVECITCPEDSYPTAYRDVGVEDKCVCFTCKEQECAGGKRPVVKRKGTGFPGSCCDLYDCEPIPPSNNTCIFNNTIYPEGSSYSTPDGPCKCLNGISLCYEKDIPENIEQPQEYYRPCLSNNKLYQHNETWAQDSCTNCTCVDGKPNCIAYLCDLNRGQLEKAEAECLPLANCNRMCPNGFKTNRRGCQICKCSKGGSVEEILRSYNVTQKDLVVILEERLRGEEEKMGGGTTSTSTSTSTSTTSAPATTVQILDTCVNKVSDHSTWLYSTTAVSFIFGALLTGAGFLFCQRRKNKTSVTMSSYSYTPVAEGKTENNNKIYTTTLSENNNGIV